MDEQGPNPLRHFEEAAAPDGLVRRELYIPHHRICPLRLPHFLKVPVQKIGHNFQQLGQVAGHSVQQAQVDVTVLNHIDACIVVHTLQGVDHVVEHPVDVRRPLGRHSQVLPRAGENRAEDLGEQQAEGKADLVVRIRQADPQHILVPVLPVVVPGTGIVVEAHLPGQTQVMVVPQFQITGGHNRKAAPEDRSLHIHDLPGEYHLRLLRRGEAVCADLAVIPAGRVEIRGPAQDDPALRGDHPHLVVLAVIGHELPGQDGLCHMPEHPGVNVRAVWRLLLHDVVGVFQRGGKVPVKVRPRNAVAAAGTRDDGVRLISDGLDFQHRAVCKGVCPQQPAQGLKGVFPAAACQPQLLRRLRLRNRADGHEDHQLQQGIALRLCVVRDQGGNRIGIGEKHLLVAAHVIPQQVVLGKNVDKHLVFPPGEERPHHAEETAELVLRDDELLFPGGRAPEAGDKTNLLVEAFLLSRQIHIPAEGGIVLARDPFQVPQGRLGLTVPCDLRNLVFHRGGSQLQAVAQKTSLLVKEPLAHKIAVRIPGHPRIGTPGNRHGRHIGDLRVEQVGHGVHQPVCIAVTDAVHRRAVVAAGLLCQDTQANLSCIDHERRLQQQDKLRLAEERAVGRQYLHVVHLPEAQDTHLAVRRLLVQFPRPPHGAQVGVVPQQLCQPGHSIPAGGAAGGHHQAFLPPQQGVDHRQRQIAAQVPVERVEKYNALPPHHSGGRLDAVRVKDLPAVPGEEVLRSVPHRRILRSLHLLEELGGTLPGGEFAPGVGGQHLGSKQLLIDLPDPVVIALSPGIRLVPHHGVDELLPSLAAQKMPDLQKHRQGRTGKRIDPGSRLRAADPGGRQ